jgi:L-lactate dehydrogenase complex protein LldG
MICLASDEKQPRLDERGRGLKLGEREQNNEVRRAMLATIRQHLEQSAPFDAVRGQHHADHKDKLRLSSMITLATEPDSTPVDRFKEMLEAVGGHCVVVSDEVEASEIVSRIVEKTKARRIAVSDSELAQRVVKLLHSDAELLENADASQLFDCDIGITGAQWAVAETGTLVLESDDERHRLASLVPTVHIALIEAERVRRTLGEVLGAINEKGRSGLSPTVTFITGPSRTSDIELTLAIGVHGPAELFVIILEGETT